MYPRVVICLEADPYQSSKPVQLYTYNVKSILSSQRKLKGSLLL